MAADWYEMTPDSNKKYNAIQFEDRESAEEIVEFLNEYCECKARISMSSESGWDNYKILYNVKDNDFGLEYNPMTQSMEMTDWLFWNDNGYFMLQDWIVNLLF